MVYLYLLMLLLIVWLVRFIITRDNFNKSSNLYEEFDKWFNSNGETSRPNNTEFNDLYKIVYKDLRPSLKTMEKGTFDNHKAYYINNIDVLGSFPTNSMQVAQTEYTLLNNLKDYFGKRYKENFSFAFWIKFYAFLPGHVMEWIGVDKNSVTSKILDAVYWLLLAIIALIKPNLLNLINHLLR